MEDFVTKSIGAFVVKDEARGEVEAIIAKIGAVDSDGDVFLKGSTPKGAKIKLSAYGHDVVLQNAPPAGVASVFEEGDDIVVRGRFFLTTERGREAFAVVKELGADGEWSIGFPNNSVVKGELTDELKAKGARRAIAGYGPMEGSPVFRGSQRGTRTLAVKMTKASESLTGRLEAVHEALWARNDGIPQPWYAREVFDDYIIVCEGYGKTLRVPYTMDGESVVLGEPVEVEVVYQPVKKTAEPVETKAEEPSAFEQGVLASVFASTQLAEARIRGDVARSDAARLAEEIAAKRESESQVQDSLNDVFAQFQRTAKRLGAA